MARVPEGVVQLGNLASREEHTCRSLGRNQTSSPSDEISLLENTCLFTLFIWKYVFGCSEREEKRRMGFFVTEIFGVKKFPETHCFKEQWNCFTFPPSMKPDLETSVSVFCPEASGFSHSYDSPFEAPYNFSVFY